MQKLNNALKEEKRNKDNPLATCRKLTQAVNEPLYYFSKVEIVYIPM